MSNTPHSPEVARFLEKQRSQDLLSVDVLKDIPPSFREVAEKIEKISGNWNAVQIFTPDGASVAKERAAFLEAKEKGLEYVPSFSYGRADSMDMEESRAALQDLLGEVRSWEPRSQVERIARVMLRAKILDDLATCDLVDGIKSKDDGLVRDAMNQKYPPLDDALLRLDDTALEEAIAFRKGLRPKEHSPEAFSESQIETLKGRSLDPEEQKVFFEWALSSYGLLRTDTHPVGFRVKVDPDAQVLDVRHRSSEGPVIVIPTDRPGRDPFSMHDAILLLRHEIEGHARQTANGQALFGLGGALTLDDETLYEGLAMRLENDAHVRYFNEKDYDPRFYAHAVQSAEQGKTFGAIFDDQYGRYMHVLLGIPLDEALPVAIDPEHVTQAHYVAWRTTYRVMRGHTDMTNKHAFAMRKDIGYDRGVMLDAELLANGKGHFNEVAVIAEGGLELLAEFHLTPDDLPYKDRNLTAELVRALKEDFARDTVFDMRAFVRGRAQDVLGGTETDANA